jgi:Ni,Fe-hydrogenase III small subunit
LVEVELITINNIMNSQTTSSDSNTPGAVIVVHVAVGSTNPCKVESVRRAFTEVFNAAAAARTTTTARREVQIVISTYNVSSGKIWE